ncbi:hypothetical protein ACFQ0M_44040 [Kitasatospora aburaviensis]
MLLLGGLVSLVGAVLALWLVREDEIDREEVPDGQQAVDGRRA